MKNNNVFFATHMVQKWIESRILSANRTTVKGEESTNRKTERAGTQPVRK